MVCAVFRQTGGTYLFPQERHHTLCVKLLRHHTICVKLLNILFPQQRHHTLTMCKATYHFVPRRTSPCIMCKATASPCTVVCKATYYFVPTRTSPCAIWNLKRDWPSSVLKTTTKKQTNKKKPNNNKQTSKHIKGSKQRCLLGQRHNLQIFGAIPFIKLQNDTSTTAKQWKTMKNEMKS